MEGEVNEAAQVSQSVHTANQRQKKAVEMETGVAEQETLLPATGETADDCRRSSTGGRKASHFSPLNIFLGPAAGSCSHSQAD